MISEVNTLVELTKRISPKCSKSALWRRAARKALAAASRAELESPWYDEAAREGPQEVEICQDEDPTRMSEYEDILTKLSKRVRQGT